MEFHPTENQTMIAQAVRDLCEREVRPNLMDWDERQYFPKELFTKHFGPAGMLGVFVPEEYGGAGLGYHEYVDTIVEVSRICGSIGLSVAAHNSLCTGHINYFGNDAQKKKWLTKLATGEWLGAWAITEPSTGSDTRSSAPMISVTLRAEPARLRTTPAMRTLGSYAVMPAATAAADLDWRAMSKTSTTGDRVSLAT